jgi:acyl transferase domain-containing protein/thioesterase domain-containing protein
VTRDASAEPIAVIGLAARFPGAPDAATFWRNLRDGVDAIQVWPDADLIAAGVDRSLLDDPSYVKAGARMPDAAGFDAAFFGYAPAEVEAMDPQQCIFLECAWSALEDAGVVTRDPDVRVGVFGGANPHRATQASHSPGDGRYQVNTGIAPDYLTSRVSYKLNLTGPSVTVQTACSTSLVAVVMACQSLRDRRCEIAIAGGVSVGALRPAGYRYQDGGLLSPDGRCRAFDAQARGAVFGSGVGVVVLERLSAALARGHRVDAIVIGAAVNNDGGSRPGFAAPSIDGQSRVVVEALEDAGVSARTIGLVEAHGSGTFLGDPIEIEALTRAFRAYTPDRGFCAIGSVKTNVGHLDAAAGIAGFIKAVLAVKHGVTPAHLHYDQPNPQIDFAASPFVVNATRGAWDPAPHPRRAGVSSFGLGGTNAHVVIEAPPRSDDPQPGRPLQLLTFSARTPEALAAAERQFARHVRDAGGVELADAAYTLSARRAFDVRSTIVAATSQEAADLLERGATIAARPTEGTAPIFMFSGLGDHYLDMGRALYDEEREFREGVDECARLFNRFLPGDLRDVLYPGWREPRRTRADDPSPRSGIDLRAMLARGAGDRGPLDNPQYAHCAVFAVQYTLARLLMHWGIRPHTVAGHSLGELTAACVAGILSLEDACTVVAQRARAIGELPPGAMLAVPIAETDAPRFLNADLSLAAVNAPAICVFSGPIDAIDRLQAELAAANIVGQQLPVSRAFHSDAMRPTVEPIEALLRSTSLKPPRVPIVSCLTGQTMTDEAVEPGYWARHASRPVRFVDALRTLLAIPGGVLVEIGPGQSLCSFAEATAAAADCAMPAAVPTMPASYDTRGPLHGLLTAVGRLWIHGIRIRWDRFYEDQRRAIVPLPTYPFERTTFWVREQPVAASVSAFESAPATTDATPSRPLQPKPRSLDVEHVPPRNAVERALQAIWQRLLGFEGIGILDDFFALGGHSLLALQFANELWRSHRIEMPLRTLIEQPTIASQALLLSDRLEPTATTAATPVDAVLVEREDDERPALDYLRETIAGSLGVSPRTLDPHRRLDDQQLRAIAPDLIAAVRRRFGLRIYPNEIAAHPSIAELARHLAAQVARRPPDARDAHTENGVTGDAPLSSAAFILSSVRSGSTLFRVMLAGHPDLFCPPELHLLPYADMAERRRRERSPDRDQGIRRAFMELLGIGSDEAERLTDDLDETNATTRNVYRRLQALADPRRLVDKSPGNANTIESLESAERDFDAPRYLVLTRHPYAVIESFVRNRFAQLMGVGDLDPFEFAEYVWQRSYGNILAFVDAIDAGRRLVVPFERLVASPAPVMSEVCDVLGVRYADTLLHPYEGRRMRDGLGDPNLLDRSAIDASLADAWRTIELPRRLGPFTAQLAERMGYELPNERRRVTTRPVRRQRPHVVAMNAPCDGDPLFCVHPLDGSIACYVGLARALAGSIHLAGLEADDADGRADDSIEDMAARYLGAVRDRQPRGPYSFAGWSMGGIVAYEMARQAVDAGERVNLLAVVDSPAPGQREPAADHDEAYYLAMFAQFVAARLHVSLDVTADALRRATPAEQLRLVQDRLSTVGLPVAATGWVERGVRQLRRNLVALCRYRPATYSNGMLLFQSSVRPGSSDDDDWGPIDDGPEWRHADGVYGWTGLVSGEIERIAVRGAHHMLMGSPHVEPLAGELAARLQRGANAGARPHV